MRADLFDRYQARASLVHALDPRAKVVMAVLFILSNVLLPDGAWAAFLISWGAILGISLLARLGPGFVVNRSVVALPFVLAAVSAIFSVPGRPVAALELGAWRLLVTEAGLIRFASIVVRSWLSVQIAILLAATTHFPDLLHALRHLYVPKMVVAVVAFMYRYLFVLADESTRLLRARDARSPRPEGGGGLSAAWRARVAGNMVGQLFLRSFERSDRVYSAMLARGYTGQLLTLNPHAMQAKDWLALLLLALFSVSIQVFSRL
ncbi:MAG TPA: cobalt ECF transporter T component CbiQ [Anaerolineales bacterium]